MRIYNIIKRISLLVIAAIAVSGCSQAIYQSASYSNDGMYAVHSRENITKKKEARIARWVEMLNAQRESQSQSYAASMAEQSDMYNSPYGQRLLALAADEYQKPASYYEYQYDAALEELAKYDPDYYSATISENGEIIVSPRYMNSTYGMWSTPGYYDYAWAYGYPHWSYYSMWGYPHHPRHRWSIGYRYSYYSPWWVSPYYYDSYFWPYYYGSYYGSLFYPSYAFGYGWYSPMFSPSYGGSIGRRTTQSIVNKVNIPQSSSQTVRNSNGSTVGRTSGNSGTYNRSTTRTTTTTPSYTTSPSRVTTPSSSGSSSSGSSTKLNSIGR